MQFGGVPMTKMAVSHKSLGPFINYVTLRGGGGGGISQCDDVYHGCLRLDI